MHLHFLAEFIEMLIKGFQNMSTKGVNVRNVFILEITPNGCNYIN